MNLVERVSRLEGDLAYLRAIVDGGEAQTREAITIAIGLLASFAAKSHGLDLGRLVEFLSDGADPQPATDDRTAMLIHGIRLMLIYHRDLGAQPSDPTIAGPQLTAGEEQAILRRAKASLDFEREARRSPGGQVDPVAPRASPGSRH